MSSGSIQGFNLEELRNIFRDNRSWIELAKVIKIEPADDRSLVRVLVEQFPEGDQIVCRMSWPSVGPDAGFYQLPSIGDMVLVALEDGDRDNAYVIKSLSSKEDTIPQQAIDGDTIVKALAGKNTHISSDTGLFLGKGDPDTPPDEPIVLGNALKTALETYISDRIIEILDEFLANPVGMGNLGNAVPLFPALSTKLTTIKAGIETDKANFDDFLSDLAFSEKG